MNIPTGNISHILTDAGLESSQNQVLSNDARLSHIKKEKSRDAARSRRGRENCQFYALATLLPIPEEISSQLDKASIIRLTMSNLQLQEFFTSTSLVKFSLTQSLPKLEHNGYIASKEIAVTLQNLDGFLIIINKKGRCLFVSNTISDDLGLSQVDVIGSNISNFVHESDREELSDHLNQHCCERTQKKFCLSLEADQDNSRCCCSFFIRMKSTQARRGLGIKSSGYKVVHITGYCVSKDDRSVLRDDASSDDEREWKEDPVIGFAGVARVLSHTPLEFAPHEPVFVVKVDRSLKITSCDEQLTRHADYDPDEVRGCTLYQFVHTYDLEKIRTCHIEILEKLNLVTPYYRWLLKNGVYIWVQSRCSIILERHTSDEDHFLWITHVIGRGQDDIPNICVTPAKSNSVSRQVSTAFSDAELPEPHSSGIIVKTEKPRRRSTSDDGVLNLMKQKIPLPALQVAANIKPPPCKLVKQTPEKPMNLKRVRSSNSDETCSSADDSSNLKNPKVEADEKGLDLTPLSTVTSCWNGAETPHATGDVLDVNSTKWGNPPNREVSNHSDLYKTVMHHHYHYGIDPNLLNSNPLFAKMLTTNYVTYESLFQRDAFILPHPAVNILAPVLGPIQPLIPAQQTKLNYSCPPSVASIIDELRKDPIREKNPPNKVVLSRSHIPSTESLLSPEPSPQTLRSLATPPIFTFPTVSSILPSLNGPEVPGSNTTPIFLHPVKLAHSTISSLPI